MSDPSPHARTRPGDLAPARLPGDHPDMGSGQTPDANQQLPLITHLMYGLHTLSWFSAGVFSLVALFLNYAKRSTLRDHFHRSHFRWQSRSFWYTVMWLVATAPLWVLFVYPGYAAWFMVGLWYLYRFIKGWWCYIEGKSMPVDTSDMPG